jgi:hypothetical protein
LQRDPVQPNGQTKRASEETARDEQSHDQELCAPNHLVNPRFEPGSTHPCRLIRGPNHHVQETPP